MWVEFVVVSYLALRVFAGTLVFLLLEKKKSNISTWIGDLHEIQLGQGL
jgi:hypothetical protein